jgi:hypothetical protein
MGVDFALERQAARSYTNAMSRRAAIITQADVARAIRAAKQAGAARVEVRPDGTIVVHISGPPLAPDLDDDLPPVIL